jgi:hypothetical protein
MKPEVLLKAFALHQSEDGFRELVAGTLDDVYSRALRIVRSPQHLVEEVVLKVYWELAREAPRLGEEVSVDAWLREHTCKAAAKVLYQDNRAVDRAALEKEREGLATEMAVAPPGLAIRVSQGILLNLACHKSAWPSLPHIAVPAWLRPVHFGAAAACLLAAVVLWNNPFHKRNPIVMSSQTGLTPASFGQLATAEDGFTPPASDSQSQAVEARRPDK